MKSNTDQLRKEIDLAAPVSRVWRALTDHHEFGAWFRVNLAGPFVPGKTTHGTLTFPGYEHLKVSYMIERMEPETYFSFRWHPYAIDPKVDYSKEQPTLVEFRLEKTVTGTHLTVTESGFDAIPAHRRDEAFRMNSGGWAQQLVHINAYIKEKP